MDISDKAQRDWLAAADGADPQPARSFTAEESRAILFQLVAAEEFEKFLHTRYVGQKRFSLEGAEALIPLLNTLDRRRRRRSASKRSSWAWPTAAGSTCWRTC